MFFARFYLKNLHYMYMFVIFAKIIHQYFYIVQKSEGQDTIL